MKLHKILDKVNSLEKNSFLKIIDSIKSCNPRNSKEIDQILSDDSKDLKCVDSINIAKVFNLVKTEFRETIKQEFLNTTSQLDIFLDILIKDGNSILTPEWLSKLYNKELDKIRRKTQSLKAELAAEKSALDDNRKRDYSIYKACIETAYRNDTDNNRDAKITSDEHTILLTLSKKLELSQEEVKLINYLIIPPRKIATENITSFLKNIGIIFYSRKNNLIYVADEIVSILREIREKELADKHLRRILKSLREPQINIVCKKHNIDIRDLDYEAKIKSLIEGGVSARDLLYAEIHKEGTKLPEKKSLLKELWEKRMNIPAPLKGVTLEEKVENIITYFQELEKDDKVNISIEGYEKLLMDIHESIENCRKHIDNTFEFPEDMAIDNKTLLDYNIKPRDLLETIPNEELKEFAISRNIKTRGDLIKNILEAYKDTENLLIENYEAIGYRDLAHLKENRIIIKESELGLKFEEITRLILTRLGFNVDEKLKKSINTTKDKADILLNLGNNSVIIIECKTVKESGYNKFSSVSKQIKAYVNLAKSNGLNVVKSLLIAPEFSDDFINECDLEFEINLSLITASSLVKILNGFKESRLETFPYKLLMKDVLIKEDRILKAIRK
jgi:hypothetical protein